MTQTPKSDVVQINLLTFSPYGNPNRDASGHPKSMSMLNTTRGRWSTQSQKAALRASAHLSPVGCGVRSRNLAIEAYHALSQLEGMPESLRFAGAEIVRSGLGNGVLRKPNEIIRILIKEFMESMKSTLKSEIVPVFEKKFPKVKLYEPKPKRGKSKEAPQIDASLSDSSPETGLRSNSAIAEDIAEIFIPAKSSKNNFFTNKNGWLVSWENEPKSIVATLLDKDVTSPGGVIPSHLPETAKDHSRLRVIAGVFQADQPLLYSSHEIEWRNGFLDKIKEAWGTEEHERLGKVYEIFGEFAPKGEVKSPMPSEVVDCDIALFGRMVASMPEATVEAAFSIAHSMTVSEFNVEADYFTAQEERPRDASDGVGHIGHTFWGSGIHHRYATVDMNLLRANLMKGGRSEDDARKLAEEALAWILRAFATTQPSGKSSNSATFCPASFIMMERGASAAVNLSVAFSRPIGRDVADPMHEAIARIRDFKTALTRVYGSDETLQVCAYPGVDAVAGQVDSLEDAIKKVTRR